MSHLLQTSHLLHLNWAGIGFCLGMLALVVGAGLASNGLRMSKCGGPGDPPTEPDEVPIEPAPEPHDRHLVDFDSSRFTVTEAGTIEAQCSVEHCSAVVVISPNLGRANVVRFPPQPVRQL